MVTGTGTTTIRRVKCDRCGAIVELGVGTDPPEGWRHFGLSDMCPECSEQEAERCVLPLPGSGRPGHPRL